jgi:hypothetical protein
MRTASPEKTTFKGNHHGADYESLHIAHDFFHGFDMRAQGIE